MKDVPGFGGKYSIDKHGLVYSHIRGKYISPSLDAYGYPRVNLRRDGKNHSRKIHRLVAELFITNPQSKPQVNHIDGNKENFDITNLEWSTPVENYQHAVKNGLRNLGEQHPQSKLTNHQVREIRRKYERRKYTVWKLSKEFGVSVVTINSVLSRRTWKHI